MKYVGIYFDKGSWNRLLQVANFTVGLTFLSLLKKLGTGNLYTGFACICFAAALFVRRYVLETKGRTQGEIEAMLMANI